MKLKALFACMLLPLVYSGYAAGIDCRGLPVWVSGPYNWVQDSQFVVHNNWLWGHKDYVNAEPGTSALWVKKDTCLKTEYTFKYDTVKAGTSSSSSVSSSSSAGAITTDVTWKGDAYQTLRCDLSGSLKDSVNQSCLDPEQLRGAVLKVPRNVTRVSKDMFTLCNIRAGEAKPTVIAYILDRSTSMNTNYGTSLASDPDSMADNAIAAGMDKQAQLSPSSYAGFITFNKGIQDSVRPVRLNLGSNLQELKDYLLNARFDGYTWYIQPMNTAVKWLGSSAFDGYRKAIVFVSDGGPNDAVNGVDFTENQIRDSIVRLVRGASAAGNVIDFHGIYLNADSTSQGKQVLRSLSDSAGGTFTSLTKASDMTAVIEKIVKNTLVDNTPIGMQVENKNTQQFISANISDLKQQADSSWRVGLNTNLSLNVGKNDMAFKTLYKTINGDTTSTDINFSIIVTDSAYNQEIDLKPAPFATKCYEPNMLRLYPEGDSTAKLIARKHQKVWVNFTTIEPKGFGDSVLVKLRAQTGDSLSLYLPVVQKTVPIKYGKMVQIDWQKSPSGDTLIQLLPVDLMYGEWHHPTDVQDASLTKIPVLWEMSRPNKVTLYDRNHDGRLDSLLFGGGIKVEEWMLPFYQVSGQFWNDSSTAEQKLNWSQYGKFGLSADSNLIWRAEGERLGLATGLPHQVWNLNLASNGQVVDSMKLTMVDQMNPVLARARIVYKDKAGQSADLSLRFTENLRRDSLTTHPGFDFVIKGVRQENLRYKNGRWQAANEYRIPYMVDDAEFSVLPDDSVRPKSGSGYIQDSAGLYAYENAVMTPIDGELPVRIKVKQLGQVDDMAQEDTALKLMDLDGSVDPDQWIAERPGVSLVLGPFKVAKDSTSPVFRWNVSVYDGMGQFLVERSGSVDCGSAKYSESCKSRQGIYQGLQWSHRDEKGRRAGVGAYIVRVRVGQIERFYTVGLTRVRKEP